MSAFERAWLFLKQGGLPDLFGAADDADDDNKPKLPDIFDAGGNMASSAPTTQKVSAQQHQQSSAPAIAAIGEGPQLAVLGDRHWGRMHDDDYPKDVLYQDMETFDAKMQEWIDIHGMPSHIISGGFGGTDDLAQQWAEDNGVELTVHSPRFKEDGRWNALGARNDRIIDAASHVLLFPHPLGSATQDAHMKAARAGKPVHSHSITSPVDTPLRDGSPKEKEEQPHWYREFLGDMGAKVLPEGKSRVAVGDKDRLAAAMRRVHGKEFSQGTMRQQSKTDRENRTSSRTIEGFPMRAPFTSASGRHIPKDTRTEEEKAHDRLIEMAQEAGSQIQVQPREGGGKSKEQQLEEIREAKRLSNEEATQAQAMANLPIPRSPASTMSDHHEAQMREDMAAMAEGRSPKKITRKVPIHRGRRGGRSREDSQFQEDNEESDAMADEDEQDLMDAVFSEDIGGMNHPLAEKERQRRERHNAEDNRRARHLQRQPNNIPILDDDGRLADLEDPHFIDDLRFQKMLRGLSPIDQAFAIIKGFSYAR